MESGLKNDAALPVSRGGQTHEELMKTMKGIDLILANGSTLDWKKFLPHHRPYFEALSARMQNLYYTDACAPFFDAEAQRWMTCWYG